MKSLIFVLLFFSQTFLYANGDPVNHTTTIRGTVLESGSNETLAGVRVSLPGTDVFTYSDRDGNFFFESIPSGEVALEFNLVSFQSTSKLVNASGGNPCELTIQLTSR